jgi:hypothetical protein
MIAANSVSSGVFGVPPPCGRTRSGGINGFAISHSPSGTIQLQVPRPITGPTSRHHVGHGLRSVPKPWTAYENWTLSALSEVMLAMSLASVLMSAAPPPGP